MQSNFTKEHGLYHFNGYLSDDRFLYFRCWLILIGKEFFEGTLQEIENFVSGKYHFYFGDTWAESLLYVTDHAYTVHHENQNEIRDAVYAAPPELHDDSTAGIIS
ncbi:hypothetical protein ABIC56_001612 [Acinetobacter bereziniae]|uniref:DUF4240 domain-containing protein n=1 Tax=Acinetobacter bereziniae TaxID=106648 RepID=UPI001D17EBF1|nr:DUF4240 domain-containing protein [Acinetobacter bereziniae]MDR6541195.1 hypothetical protein [Acinetobacter bereziniae]